MACHKRRPTPHNQCLGTLSSETVGVRAVFLGRSGLPKAGSKGRAAVTQPHPSWEDGLEQTEPHLVLGFRGRLLQALLLRLS